MRCFVPSRVLARTGRGLSWSTPSTTEPWSSTGITASFRWRAGACTGGSLRSSGPSRSDDNDCRGLGEKVVVMGDAIDELIEEVIVDAQGEAEQLWSFRQAFEDRARLPRQR